MFLDNHKPVFEEAIKVWGETAQLDKVIEECAELIHALQKLKLKYATPEEKEEAYWKACDEVADVKITLAQAELILNKKCIEERCEFKINRLAQRIQKEKKRSKINK